MNANPQTFLFDSFLDSSKISNCFSIGHAPQRKLPLYNPSFTPQLYINEPLLVGVAPLPHCSRLPPKLTSAIMHFLSKLLVLGLAAIYTVAVPLSDRSISEVELRSELFNSTSSISHHLEPSTSLDEGPPLGQTFRRDDSRKEFRYTVDLSSAEHLIEQPPLGQTFRRDESSKRSPSYLGWVMR